jgi:hypothetical protein
MIIMYCIIMNVIHFIELRAGLTLWFYTIRQGDDRVGYLQMTKQVKTMQTWTEGLVYRPGRVL